MRISDWSSDVCSSDLSLGFGIDVCRKQADLCRPFVIGDAGDVEPCLAGLVVEIVRKCDRLRHAGCAQRFDKSAELDRLIEVDGATADAKDPRALRVFHMSAPEIGRHTSELPSL